MCHIFSYRHTVRIHQILLHHCKDLSLCYNYYFNNVLVRDVYQSIMATVMLQNKPLQMQWFKRKHLFLLTHCVLAVDPLIWIGFICVWVQTQAEFKSAFSVSLTLLGIVEYPRTFFSWCYSPFARQKQSTTGWVTYKQ